MAATATSIKVSDAAQIGPQYGGGIPVSMAEIPHFVQQAGWFNPIVVKPWRDLGCGGRRRSWHKRLDPL